MVANSLVLHALLSGLAPVASAELWVVDQRGGAGADFSDLQTAVDAASDGDTLLVRTGTYPAFVIEGKSISIVADTGAEVVVASPARPTTEDFTTVAVRDLALGQRVLLHGLRVCPTPTGFFPTDLPPALLVESIQGTVWIEDCEVLGNDSFLGSWSGSAAELVDVRTFVAIDCSFGAPQSGGFSNIPGTTEPGFGLHAHRSQVFAYGCLFLGGQTAGGATKDSGQGPCLPGGVPGHGVLLEESSMFASECELRGGSGSDGGFSSFPAIGEGGTGGDGVHLADAGGHLVLRNSIVVAGTGGQGAGFCSDGLDGTPIHADAGSSFEVSGGSVASFEASSPVRTGRTGMISVSSAANSFVLVGASEQTNAAYLPFLDGSLLPGPTGQVISLGVLSATGSLDYTLTIAALPLDVGAVTLVLQPLLLPPDATWFLGPPATLTVLGAAVE